MHTTIDQLPPGAACFYVDLNEETGKLQVNIREGFAYNKCPAIQKLDETEDGTLYSVGEDGDFFLDNQGVGSWTNFAAS